MIIDRVFVINLKERKDRRDAIINELNRVNIKNYEFFDGIKPSTEDMNEWNPNYIKIIPEWFKRLNKSEIKYRIGALGCLLSHYNIIKESKKRGYKNILILEDDTIFKFNDEFTKKINRFEKDIKIIESIYGILYLTGNHGPNSLKLITNNIFNTRNTLSTSSYIISSKGMNYVIDNLKNYGKEIDVFYAEELQQKIPCFCIIPHLTGQSSSYSDIAQIDVNYSFL